MSEWAVIRWESKSSTISSGAAPAAQARSRAFARARRRSSRRPRARSIARHAVALEAAEEVGLLAQGAEV